MLVNKLKKLQELIWNKEISNQVISGVILYLLPLIGAFCAYIAGCFNSNPAEQVRADDSTSKPPIVISVPVPANSKTEHIQYDTASIVIVEQDVTADNIVKTDTLRWVYWPNSMLDFRELYDTLVPYKNRYYQRLTVKLRVVNPFDKPLNIHKIRVIDTFQTSFHVSVICPSAGGKNPDSSKFDQRFIELPDWNSVNYNEQGNVLVNTYLKKNQVYQIKGDTTIYILLNILTKKKQNMLFCKVLDCDGCKATQKVEFTKDFSFIEIVWDKPIQRGVKVSTHLERDTLVVYKRGRKRI